MAVNGIALKEDQRWVTHSGDIGTLRLSGHPVYPWLLDLDDGTGSYSYTSKGLYDTAGYAAYLNLMDMIEGCQDSSSSYSIDEIAEAFADLEWGAISFMKLKDKLQELEDPEYAEYLRLKNKFQK